MQTSSFEERVELIASADVVVSFEEDPYLMLFLTPGSAFIQGQAGEERDDALASVADALGVSYVVYDTSRSLKPSLCSAFVITVADSVLSLKYDCLCLARPSDLGREFNSLGL